MTQSNEQLVEAIAAAIREEQVRQYRDDERGKCPGGAHFYEEHVGPYKLARAAIAAMQQFPTPPLVNGD